ncbi:hypothetical protein WJX84_002220 [Apatococcus fuscideae]|uniref:Uncharacterized protein n=1 Tax=Apatococcus fuscideae TaxID=2026836 RepID=A0AAW1SSG1_9CHLO
MLDTQAPSQPAACRMILAAASRLRLQGDTSHTPQRCLLHLPVQHTGPGKPWVDLCSARTSCGSLVIHTAAVIQPFCTK